jgi:translation initiation factor 2B subunit (eIF-2B alpha/beta/delta family)
MTRESIVSTATSDSFIRDLSQKTIKSLPMTTTSSSSTITTHSSTSTVTDKLLENMSRECLLFPTYAKRDPSG